MGSLPELLENMKSGALIQTVYLIMVKLGSGEQIEDVKEEEKIGAKDA